MNYTTLFGFVGKDPIERVTASGKKMMEFSLAVESYHNREKVTDWYKIMIWDEGLRALCEKVKKGYFIAVMGELSHPTIYETKDHEKKINLALKAKYLILTPSRKKEESNPFMDAHDEPTFF